MWKCCFGKSGEAKHCTWSCCRVHALAAPWFCCTKIKELSILGQVAACHFEAFFQTGLCRLALLLLLLLVAQNVPSHCDCSSSGLAWHNMRPIRGTFIASVVPLVVDHKARYFSTPAWAGPTNLSSHWALGTDTKHNGPIPKESSLETEK